MSGIFGGGVRERNTKKSKCLDRERVLTEAPNAKTKTIFMKNIMLARQSNTLIPKHIDLIGEAEL